MSNFKEISNPSDKAFIDVEDKEAACLAVVVFTSGKYGITDLMPPFIFGGHDEWFIKEFGRNLEESLTHVGNKRIAKALRTVKLDGERTSSNDIVSKAERISEILDLGAAQ